MVDNVNIYGEIFTPLELVQEMLDQFPKTMWQNPSYTYLDPCAGEGIFGQCILDRLMKGLEQKIPELVSRRRHVLSKMLYMIEINKKNVVHLRARFGKMANIVHGDFLDPIREHRGFNVIVANPPYQSTKKENYVGSVGNRTLWDKFILKSFELVSPNGYLAYITPSSWRRPEHPLYSAMCIERKLLYLHIHSKADGLAIFDAQTRFDMYVIQNKPPDSSLPIIIDEKGKRHRNIDPRQWPFLPNYAYDLVRKHMTTKKQSEIIYNSSMYDARYLSEEKNRTFRWPIIHTLGHRNGIGIKYADKNVGHFGFPKVILNVNEKQYPVNDFKGEYGMSQLSFGIPIDPRLRSESARRIRGEQIIAIIQSQEFEEVIKATKWASFQTDYRMFKYFCFDFSNRVYTQR